MQMDYENCLEMIFLLNVYVIVGRGHKEFREGLWDCVLVFLRNSEVGPYLVCGILLLY